MWVKRTLILGLASAAMSLGLGMAPASAATIDEILNTGGGGEWLLSDNNAEYLINGPNSTGESTLEVGDRLRGIIGWETAEQQFAPGDTYPLIGADQQELTALFDITVTSITTQADGCPENFCFTFGATAGFDAEMAALGFTDIDGAAIAYFIDNTQEFTRNGTIANAESLVTDGTAYWLFGFEGSDFWNATSSTNDVSGFSGTPTADGNFNVGLSLLENLSGVQLGLFDCLNPFTNVAVSVQGCASGGLLAPGALSEYDLFTNADMTIQVVPVPEPATIGIFGLGLLGLGLVGRRRRRSV